jgi:hypothetical protein
MKAIKFVILAAGLLGLAAIILPLLNVKLAEDRVLSFTAVEVIGGVEVAKEAASNVRDAVVAEAGVDAAAVAAAGQRWRDLQEAFEAIQGIVVAFFLPALLLTAIGVTGAIRGKLGRLGGAGALLLGLLGTGVSGFVIAVLSDPRVSENGGSPGAALYLLALSGVVGLLGGLLTVIKPDGGGRFG